MYGIDLNSISLNDKITKVQINSMVVLKIIHHSQQNISVPVTGQLLGLDINGILEVTDSFALPLKGEDDDYTNYDYEMMKYLGEVNVDNNPVGWYHSSYLGLHINQFLVETQFSYQSNIPNAVVIIYDPLASAHGSLSIKAFRLTDTFMELYREKNFTKEGLSEKNFSFNNIFEEFPIEITQPALHEALLNYLEPEDQTADQRYDFDFATDDFMAKNLEVLMYCLADLQKEQQLHTQWQRNSTRLEQQQKQFLEKRKVENDKRKKEGNDPLPESLKELELENPQVFRKPPESSRLESLLISHRISTHCQQITAFVGNSGQKLLNKSVILSKE